MTDFPLSKSHLQSVEIETEDLRVIYDNIDENMAFWQVMHNDEVNEKEEILPLSLSQVIDASDWLKMSSAPLYLSQGVGGARGIAYRFLNIPIKVFGSPLIRFNRKLREFLDELMITLKEIIGQAHFMRVTIEDQNTRIQDLEIQNRSCHQEIDILTTQIAELRADLAKLKKEQGGENRV